MGLKFKKFFSNTPITMNHSVDTEIRNDKGEVIFKQDGVVVPGSFSNRAATIIASQYLRGQEGVNRETSFITVVDRVVGQILKWADKEGTFDSSEDREIYKGELEYILKNQFAAFNSPVWYNLGVEGENQQGSACFIGDVEDDMESISERQTIEARIFKWGSGFGANNSKLRGSKEPLSGGGNASGPVSFMLVWDANAEVVRSAGKRRAAKMELLDADHPDILKFITCKGDKEEIAKLVKQTLGKTGINELRVDHQNANHSIVASDEFMTACASDQAWDLTNRRDGSIADSLPADYILTTMAEQAWKCGDPGLFFIDTVNKFNTVPEWGKIVSCNPCAEFVQPPWSACNLASINLIKFFHEGNTEWEFDRAKFIQVVGILTVAMDLISAHGDYPDERIRANSIKYRPLGLGYTNLGAVLIKLGMPYDSPAARDFAAKITSLMSATAWHTSAYIQESLGSVRRFDAGPVIKVLEAQRAAIPTKGCSGELYVDKLNWRSCTQYWDAAIKLAEANGVSNSQVTLLAPTGTISFLMDCETTGIEPLPMLGGVKKMADTGVMSFSLPKCVDSYLLDKAVREDAESLTTDDGKGGLEWNAQDWFLKQLKEERVLDTAMGGMGMGTISTDGHMKMMAAVQPFLSGAISKTVNLPNDVTVEEIKDVFLKAWQLGLKSIAVYRDGSKFEQPLNLGKAKETVEKTVVSKVNGLRNKLPAERASSTHKFQIGDHKGYLISSLYEDDKLGEIFILMNKQGSTVRGLLDSVAMLVSICLQYGVPLQDLVNKFKGVKFEPQGITTNRDIMFAQSPMDYIFRYLEQRYLSEHQEESEGEVFKETIEDTGDPCSACGSSMLRRGSCMYCDNCDITTGCS